MKKVILLLALSAFTTAAFAQTTPTTEVKVRDNGTVVTKTGKTNVGQTLDNTKDAAGNVVHKTGHAIKSGAKRGAHAVKRGGQKVGTKAKQGSAKLESKTE